MIALPDRRVVIMFDSLTLGMIADGRKMQASRKEISG
jgi:hypothetical protein